MNERAAFIGFTVSLFLFFVVMNLWLEEVKDRKIKEHAVDAACRMNKLPDEFCRAYKGEENASKKSKWRL